MTSALPTGILQIGTENRFDSIQKLVPPCLLAYLLARVAKSKSKTPPPSSRPMGLLEVWCVDPVQTINELACSPS